MKELLNTLQKKTLLDLYLYFMNAEQHPKYKEIIKQYGKRLIEKFNDYNELDYLVELLSDMEEYNYYIPQWYSNTLDNDVVFDMYPLFTNLGEYNHYSTNRLNLEHILSCLFGSSGFNDVQEYRKVLNLGLKDNIGEDGISFLLRGLLNINN